MEILVIFITICIIALFTFSTTYINLLNNNNAGHQNKYIQKILKSPGKYMIRAELVTTTLGYLISNIAVDIYAIPIVMSLAKNSNQSVFALKYTAIVIIAIISAYITTILGKYIPKRLAINANLKNDNFILYFFSIISILLLPFTAIANIFDGLIKKLLKTNTDKEYLSNEIVEFTNIEYGKGTIKKYEKDLIDRTIKLNDTTIYDVCTTIDNVVSIEINSDLNDILAIFKEHEYSRIPVYKGEKNNIIGAIYIKDILFNLKEMENGKLDLKDIIRLPLYENKNMLLSAMLRKMKSKKIHIVIVKDTDDTVLGIVTLENITGKILGNMKDEFEN